MPAMPALVLASVVAQANLPPPSEEPRNRPVVFGRLGWARLMDDEGSLGGGASFGAGLRVPRGRRIAMEERVAASVADRRFTAAVLGAFAAAALLLSAVRVYGVLSHTVARRTHEIGIRMALGADARALVRMVRAGALRPVGVGVAVGALAALVLGRFIAAMLYGVGPADPRSFAVAAAALFAVAWLAASLPARRATAVDPIVVLRAE